MGVWVGWDRWKTYYSVIQVEGIRIRRGSKAKVNKVVDFIRLGDFNRNREEYEEDEDSIKLR